MWNQPVFWLMSLPLLAAAGLWLADRWPRAQAVGGAALAWLLVLWLWSRDLAVSETIWPLYGRSFSLTPGLQTFFVFLYLIVGLLCLLAWLRPAGPRFVPVALGLLAPAAAMLLVRPFLLAPPFWLLLASLALLLLYREQPGSLAATQAALRYWLLLLVTTALLLLAVWMLEGSQAALLLPGARLLVLALAIPLAGFPFFLWLRPLVAAAPLLALPFLLVLLPLLLLAFVFQLIAAYPALTASDAFSLWLPWSGGLSVLLAGLLTWRATTWRLLLASLLLLDLGFSLLPLALAYETAWELVIITHGLRLVGLLLVIGGWRSPSVAGTPIPLTAAAVWQQPRLFLLLLGLFSLLGLPLTPGFSGRWAVLVEWGRAGAASLPLALLVVGGLGLALLGLARQMPHLLAAADTAAAEPAWQRPAALAGLSLALLLAAFPQLLLAPLTRLAMLF
jgi:NADH:ubiquinone oxidoreductase subunit 2 (subunit N)